MDEEERAFTKIPGDIDPGGPSLAWDFMNQNEYGNAIEFLKIWLDEYEPIYRNDRVMKSIIGAAKFDLIECNQKEHDIKVISECIHLSLEVIYYNTDALQDNWRILASDAPNQIRYQLYKVLYFRQFIAAKWPLTDDETASKWAYLVSAGWKSFIDGDYNQSVNLYQEAYSIMPYLQILYQLALAKYGLLRNPDNTCPAFKKDILPLIMSIHIHQPNFDFNKILVPNLEIC